MPKPLVAVWLLALCYDACMSSHDAAPINLTLHGQRFAIELASDEAAREHGLMMRTSLAADRGMLFVFPDTAKNTLIALGILYFDAGRRLLSVQPDVSPCKAAHCRI